MVMAKVFMIRIPVSCCNAVEVSISMRTKSLFFLSTEEQIINNHNSKKQMKYTAVKTEIQYMGMVEMLTLSEDIKLTTIINVVFVIILSFKKVTMTV